MGASSEVVAYKVTTKQWLFLAIFIAILTALISLLTLFIPKAWGAGGGINVGPSGGTLAAMPGPYVFAMIMLLLFPYIPWLEKIRSKPMFALLYVAVMISTWYSVYNGFYTIPAALYNVRISTATVHGYALPSFWMPSADAIRGMFYHGSLGNFFVTYANEWAPVVFTYIYWLVVAALFLLGWAVVLRRLWIDVEVLPFPYAQGWLIGETAVQKGPSRFKKYLIIAFAFGVLYYIPFMIYAVYPALPDPSGWFTKIGVGSSYMLTSYIPAVAKNIAAPLGVGVDLMRYSFLFLVPLDALFSMWFAYLVLVILAPQILSYFGFYTGIYARSTGDKISMIFFGPPLYVQAIANGMILGIFVFLILLNWKYFVETIKLAISEKTQEGEVSYKVGYGLIILGAIGLLALFMVSGVELFDAILGLIIIIVLTLSFTRARAYTAVVPRTRGIAFFKPFWGDTMPPAPQYPAGKLFICSHVSRWGIGADTWGPYCAPMMGAMDSFKIASMAGVKPKDMFKLLLIGAIVAAIVAVLTNFIAYHAFGLMELPVPKEGDPIWDGDAGAYQSELSIISLQSIAGLLLAGVLLLLRIRYAWWPLEPLGFVVGITRRFVGYVDFFTVLITWIVKYVTIKVGGRKAYEEIGVPVALGIIAGEVTGVILIGILVMIRFFFFKMA